MRKNRTRVFGAMFVALALLLAACGSDDSSGDGTTDTEASTDNGTEDDGATTDGPTIRVTSFNFPESTILAEIYAQALEAEGYPVEKNLNLGSRELIFPEIENGNIDLIPEYLGSSLVVGFAAEAPTNTDEGIAALSTQFEALNMVVLDPTPGEDKNVFVVTQAFADANGAATVADLANAGDIILGGPPECEDRATCYAGLTSTYGLANLAFESIAEGPARVAALEEGQIDIALLFSTEPVIAEKGFVALDETEGLIAPENIVPVVSSTVADAYGEAMVNLLNDISSKITTELLLDLNGRANDAQDPDEIATAWLTENGYLGG